MELGRRAGFSATNQETKSPSNLSEFFKGARMALRAGAKREEV
jgi:hypothetical protein